MWSARRRRLTVGLLLTVAVGAFEALAVGTVLPAVNAELDDVRRYGLVFSAFMLTNLIGVIVGGRQADDAPAERVFIAGTAVFSVGLVVTGLAPSMLVVALGRGLQGLGAGVVSGLSMYAVRRCYEEAARPRMLALLSTAYVVPGLVGPLVAAGVTEFAGWRWVFLGLSPLMPIAALLAIPVLRITSLDDAERSERSAGPVASLVVAVTCALVAQSVTYGPVVWTTGALALVVGAIALRRTLPPGVIRFSAGQPAAVAFILLAAVAYFTTEAFLPLSLTSVHAASILGAGLVLSAGTVTWNVGVWVQARLVRVRSPRSLLIMGGAALSVGIGATGWVMTTAALPLWLAPVAWAVVAFGMGMTSSTATLIVLEWAPEGGEGRASGLAQFANLLGGAVGTGVAGLAVGTSAGGGSIVGSVQVVVLLATGAALLTVLAGARARPNPRR